MAELDPGVDAATLLAAYDDQLRREAEVPSAVRVELHGPLVWAHFASGRGFVTYRDLGDATGDDLRALVTATAAHYRDDPMSTTVEWKTRGHDHAPGLHDLLVEHGFEPGERETVMAGRLADLVTDVVLPEDVTIRRITAHDDVRRMCAMAEVAFDEEIPGMADSLIRRLDSGRDDMELWVAEADGEIVSCGRIETVTGTDFAGLWGGATLTEWRGRGIYRALTSVRAQAVLGRGYTLVQSDCTEYSRPILERSGLVRITTTTPYEWVRSPAS